MIVKCPTCRKPVEWSQENKYRPFCSSRCKLIDLGAWLEEKMVISDACNVDTEEGMSILDVLNGKGSAGTNEEVSKDKPFNGYGT